MCVCVCRRRRVKARECALNSDDAKRFFFVCDWLCCKKLSAETLNPNSVGANISRVHFFDLSDEKLSRSPQSEPQN